MRRLLILAWIGLLLAIGPSAAGPAGAAPAPPPASTARTPAPGPAPLAFEPNAGQTAPAVRFLAHAAGATLFFTPAEVVLARGTGVGSEERALRSRLPALSTQSSAPGTQHAAPQVVRLQFVGANAGAVLSGERRLPGRVNYLRGSDPAHWQTDLPTYGGLTYQGLYPSIDLHYAGAGAGLKGTYTLAPGADPARIRWRYAGAPTVRVDAAGNLQVELPPGQGPDAALSTQHPALSTRLTEQAPLAWQERAGERMAIAARYVVYPDGSIGFALSGYDRSRLLVLDPTLTFSTYLGGSSTDYGYGVALDRAGSIYVTGQASSSDFPLTSPIQSTNHGGYADVFVTKLNAVGTALVYSTYLGGSGDDRGFALAVDGAGAAYVTGWTASPDFPTRNALQPTYGGGYLDAFVTKLSAPGDALVYSTYLGGYGPDYGAAIAVDGAGAAYVTGETRSPDFPTRHPFQPALGNLFGDAFVTKLDATGTALVYSTYLGGTSQNGSTFENAGEDAGAGIAVDAAGNAYVGGYTTATDFPLKNPIQAVCGCGFDDYHHYAFGDAFVSELNAAGTALLYSTYLGGGLDEYVGGVAVDAAGAAYVAGETYSRDFPLQAPYEPICGCGAIGHNIYGNAFVTKLAPGGSALVYSTYLGGTGEGSAGTGIVVDAAGQAIISGYTSESDFPTRDPIQAQYGGVRDAFVTQVNAAGSALVYSTYLGGSGDDIGSGIALAGAGTVYVTGSTDSPDFPLVHPVQATDHGGADAFVAAIAPLPLATPTPVAFRDVPPGAYYYGAVQYLAARGVVAGYADGTFRPAAATTRSQMVKIVVRGLRLAIQAPVPMYHTFADVPPGAPFYDVVETAAGAGIVSGYACGSGPAEPCDAQFRPYFRPYAAVTRGQLAKIIVLAAALQRLWPVVDPPAGSFADVAPGTAFYPFVETAVCHGLLSGYACGSTPGEPCNAGQQSYFRPGNDATRGQIAKIVYLGITDLAACAPPPAGQ